MDNVQGILPLSDRVIEKHIGAGDSGSGVGAPIRVVYEPPKPEIKEVEIDWNKVEEEIKRRDDVNSPSHYTSHPSGIECITITEHYNFCIGNAIKYLWRAGLKEESSLSARQKEIQDLNKAIWYIQRQIKNLSQN